jgi:flavin reductase (DIM6/NTAB) family NADH-FMN oxidoreductase RutF
MNHKKQVPLSRANRLINHGPVILVTCIDPSGNGSPGKANIITLAWNMVLSMSPPMVGIALGRGRYSHELIEKSREFVVNIPSIDLLEATWGCGRVSGRKEDKFARFKLTPLPARRVAVPLIAECSGHMECLVKEAVETGDHTLFVGEVVEALADPSLFSDHWVETERGIQTIHHLGGSLFLHQGKVVDVRHPNQ